MLTYRIAALAAALSLIPFCAAAKPPRTMLIASHAHWEPHAIGGLTVYSPKAGFLVLSRRGDRPRILGAEPVPAGKSKNLRIRTGAALNPHRDYVLTLVGDTNHDHRFEAGKDKPMMRAGQPVTALLRGQG